MLLILNKKKYLIIHDIEGEEEEFGGDLDK
jgi:hypothetical protein